MAKKFIPTKSSNDGKSVKIVTPSRYGSHRSMICPREKSKEIFVTIPLGKVVCEDEFGLYLTDESRLDNGMADPNRYSSR
jgi:hypothetical protein